MSETAERFFAATLINEPYNPANIHVSHDLECVGEVGHCKVCLEAWVGEVMTPGLASPCTKVKPRLDPMTGHPVELMECEGSSRTMEMIWTRAGRPVLKLTLDKSQPDIGERIFTGQLEITRELMGFGVVED